MSATDKDAIDAVLEERRLSVVARCGEIDPCVGKVT